MATVSTIGVGGKSLFSVKGAPEVIKRMLAVVPEGYDDTFKSFTRRGSRVLALAMREVAPVGLDKVRFCCFSSSFGGKLTRCMNVGCTFEARRGRKGFDFCWILGLPLSSEAGCGGYVEDVV